MVWVDRSANFAPTGAQTHLKGVLKGGRGTHSEAHLRRAARLEYILQKRKKKTSKPLPNQLSDLGCYGSRNETKPLIEH